MENTVIPVINISCWEQVWWNLTHAFNR